MKIAFLDPIDWDYTPSTPLERPLGGSQSAICYLTPELAALGHDVTLINSISRPGVYAGVRCPGRAGDIAPDYLNQFDAVIGINSAMGVKLRESGVTVPLILWSQQATDQKDIQGLREPDERLAWNAFFLVSDWQAGSYASDFGIRPDRIMVVRNAAAPVFQSLPPRARPFFRTGKPPVLIYTSTPFRGLLLLLVSFPLIRAAIPQCRLRVFSSMEVYQVAFEQEPLYHVLYALARDLPGVEYLGSVSQTELAAALAEADMLAYPNIFPETSCIAVMEAMAAGCLVCTSNLGALPETTAGFGFLMDLPTDILQMAQTFAAMVFTVYREACAAPDRYEDAIARQRAHAHTQYTWAARALEWSAALPRVLRSP
ncbi:MAG TPA: glycosyltransferase family 4 protein [Stellaceae bacterium]|nr:glycosyltransferase family 4 protein [Stellaceae bacterium]